MDGKLGNKRIRLAEAGENVLIPTLDTGSPFGPQNHLGVIPEGVLDSMYMVSQFQPSTSKFITAKDVPDKMFHFARQYSTPRL